MILVSAAMLALTASCRPAADRAAAEVARADALIAGNDLDGAAAALNDATELDGNNVDAWLKLGGVQLRQGDPTAADQSFQRAQELAPDNVEALDNLVILAIRGDDLDRAKRYMDALLVLQPDDPAGLLTQGTIALRERRAKDALPVAERVLLNYPDLGEAVQLRARSLVALGRQADAIAALKTWAAAHETAPAYETVLQLLLDYQRDAGDIGGIRATARRLHKIDPDEPRYAIETARAARAAGQQAEADATIAALLRAHPGTPDVVRAVLGYWRDMLPPAEARRRALALAAGAPAGTQLVVANAAIDAGDAADALRIAAPLAGNEVGPDTVDATATLARGLAALGRTAEAARRAEAVLAFDPGNLAALLVRARLRLAARDYDGAAADAQLAQSSDAGSEAATLLLARIYALQGNGALAQQALALGIQRFPDSRPMLAAYLDRLSATGQGRSALRVMGAFARRHRGDRAAWARYAAMCRAADDPCLLEAQARAPAV